MTRPHNAETFRETAAATELRTADGRAWQALGKGDAIRALLRAAAEGRGHG